MRSLPALFFIFIFFTACNSGSTPAGVIPEEEMVKVLTDIHLADGYTSSVDSYRDSIKVASIYESLYKKYNTDSVQVRKSLEYYSKNPKMLQKMYGFVNQNLAKLEKDERKKEQERVKLEQKKAKLRQQALEKKLKLQKDSLKRDSLKKVALKKASFKKDSLKRDSIKRNLIKRVQGKRNGISAKRNR